MEVISQHVLYCVLSHLGHGGDLLACLLYVEPFGHGGDFSARTVLCVEPFGAPGITITYIIYFAQCCSYRLCRAHSGLHALRDTCSYIHKLIQTVKCINHCVDHCIHK